MKFETTLVKQGGTIYMRIPPLLLKHLEIKDETEIVIVQDETGKYGNFFSAWKKGDKN